MSNKEEVFTVLKKIRARKQKEAVAKQISKACNLTPVAARILAARGYQPGKELDNYLSPTLRNGLPDPKKLKNLDSACSLIEEIINAGESIAICCDFDVDGLSGGAQVQHFFQSIGVHSKVFVPDRFTDGYGLNTDMVNAIAELGFKLMITVDYGTTNDTELTLAKEKGLKTIVIDHHHVAESGPPADVFINPNQKGCNFADKVLCASGLAWYLLIGLKAKLEQAKDIDVRSYLDLACLGTICDMVPLSGVNRVIAKRGLELLETTKRQGLIALKNVIGIHNKVGCSHVSFGIGPRLNAAGRMVHGDVVIELLTTNDSIRAEKLARQLNRLNKERQETEEEVKESAISKVKKRGYLPDGIVVWDESYHTGVIGIVAQRLVEAFYRPSAVMGGDEPGILKGSMRGIKGFNVVEAIDAVSEHLIKFGGHEGAGGFALKEENLDAFVKAFEAECSKRLKKIEKHPYAEADTEVDLNEIKFEVVEELKQFAPFGMSNPGPQLLIKNLEVVNLKLLKGAHLKATLSDGENYIPGLMWRTTHHPALVTGNKVNVVCRADYNEYAGLGELQAHLQAVEEAK